MSSHNNVIELPGCVVSDCTVSTDGVIEITARRIARAVACPECGRKSSQVHSHYTRTLSDTPVASHTVRVKLTIRRLRCENSACGRRIFAEPATDLAVRHAQRTDRMTAALFAIGMALGGAAGARLANKLHLPTSGSTVLRILRRPARTASREAVPTELRVIGIDDWARRRGYTYGVVIVDLERHRPVDLLPDRTAATLASWLKQRPNIEVIARDRYVDFANAVAQGAPQAVQVLDRWHLLQNLREAVERALVHIRLHTESRPAMVRGRSTAEDLASAARRERRKAQYDSVKLMHSQGFSSRQIAQQLKMSRNKVMLYCRCSSFPEHALRQNPQLQPFIAELCSLWQTGCRNAMQAWRQITKSGYTGSRHSVARWFRARRSEPSASTPKRYLTPAFALAQSQPHPYNSAPMLTGADSALDYSPRQLSWLMLMPIGKLPSGAADMLERVKQLPAVRPVFEAAQGFVEMVRQRDPERLEDWLSDCEATNVTALVNFARGIQKDKEAIIAALSMPWSNGQTEGQVTRLKLIKRQMYGRANLDLLRIRFLGQL